MAYPIAIRRNGMLIDGKGLPTGRERSPISFSLSTVLTESDM